MKVGRLWNLIEKYGFITIYHDNRVGDFKRVERHDICLETGTIGMSRRLSIFTFKPDGKQFYLYDKRSFKSLYNVEEEITLPHGAWCYSVWQAFQYIEDLDYFTNEAKERKIQEERDNVHNWFLENKK